MADLLFYIERHHAVINHVDNGERSYGKRIMLIACIIAWIPFLVLFIKGFSW